MKKCGLSALRSCCRRSVTAGVAVALMLLGSRVLAEDGRAGAGGGAMRIYRDPVTGAIGAPPAGTVPRAAARLQAAPQAQESTHDAAGLSAEPVSAPAGGVKLNLRGRFQSTVRRHAAPAGGVRQECLSAGGAAHE
jgi:hypothetical protein